MGTAALACIVRLAFSVAAQNQHTPKMNDELSNTKAGVGEPEGEETGGDSDVQALASATGGGLSHLLQGLQVPRCLGRRGVGGGAGCHGREHPSCE